MDLIHVTKDGIVTGDYWGGIRQVEKDKVKQAIKYREQKVCGWIHHETDCIDHWYIHPNRE